MSLTNHSSALLPFTARWFPGGLYDTKYLAATLASSGGGDGGGNGGGGGGNGGGGNGGAEDKLFGDTSLGTLFDTLVLVRCCCW